MQRALIIAQETTGSVLATASNVMRIGLNKLKGGATVEANLPNPYAEIGVACGDWWSGSKAADVQSRCGGAAAAAAASDRPSRLQTANEASLNHRSLSLHRAYRPAQSAQNERPADTSHQPSAPSASCRR